MRPAARRLRRLAWSLLWLVALMTVVSGTALWWTLQQARQRHQAIREVVAHGARQQFGAVQRAIEKQQMVAERTEDLDVIGIADDELEAAVQVAEAERARPVAAQALEGLRLQYPGYAEELERRFIRRLEDAEIADPTQHRAHVRQGPDGCPRHVGKACRLAQRFDVGAAMGIPAGGLQQPVGQNNGF